MKKGDGVVFVIFGATGDLTKRKLIPGIYNALSHGGIKKFHMLGVARRPLGAEKLINSSKKYVNKPDAKMFASLKKNSSYLQVDFNKSDFSELKLKLDELSRKGFSNRIFYLATGANNFEAISKKIKESGVLKKRSGWTRVVFEKPFGSDQKSSDKLNRGLKKIFNEDQIYRIDHYLGKELVGNISVMRFSNSMLEPLWNRDYVESIRILLNEDIGIEDRGSFYDSYGAIRDVVQNHMLQLLALTTMEMPKSFSGDSVRDMKAQVLKNVLLKKTVLGQYEGYLKEKGIPKGSKTETYAAMRFEIKNKRWAGVPILFETGKFLDKKETKIIVNFKQSACLFGRACPPKNYVEIRIFPEEGISFGINVKDPGRVMPVPTKIDFCHSCVFGANTPEGYENLLLDIIRGDQTAFIREDELRNSWKIIDKVKRGKVYSYKKGSAGPKKRMNL